MDKDLAARVLAEELVNQNKFYVVDSTTLTFYTSNAIHSAPLFKGQELMEGEGEYDKGIKARNLKANYLFITRTRRSLGSGGYVYSMSCDIISPFAVIGKEEVRQINETFYKEMPKKIAEALKALGQPDYNELYDRYSKDGLSPDKGIKIGDIIQGSQSERYYHVKEIKGDSCYGPRYLDANLTIKHDDLAECSLSNAILVTSFMPPEFLQFVFTIPKEDQNIGFNKGILKKSKLDLEVIFTSLYKEPSLFMEYFPALNEEGQKLVVNTVKSVEKQNLAINSWLFEQGFEVSLEHMALYLSRGDEGTFIKYFETLSKEEKMQVIRDIIKSEIRNPQVNKFLEEKYKTIVDEVGREIVSNV